MKENDLKIIGSSAKVRKDYSVPSLQLAVQKSDVITGSGGVKDYGVEWKWKVENEWGE